MRKNFLFPIVCLALLAGACSKPAANTNPAGGHEQHRTEPERDAPPAENYTVDFTSEPQNIVAGENAKLVLTFKDLAGRIFDDLEIVHEKRLHLIVVSEDLSAFYHLHPEPQADRSLAANFTFPTGGKYRVYADFKPKGGAQSVRNFPVQVSGNLGEIRELQADAKFEKTAESIRVRMTGGENLETNRDSTLVFDVLDAATGEFATGMEKYLGETAHFVVISQNLKDFVHAHPVSTDALKSKNEGGKMRDIPPNSTAAVHVAFPNAGLYKIFVEFKRAGRAIVVPFVVEVKKDRAEKLLEEAEIPAGAFKIVVGKDGFTPNEATLRRKNFQKLAFLRTDPEVCRDGVTFPPLAPRKKLPVGEVVLFNLPSAMPGGLNLVCDDGKFKGKVIIE